MKKFKFSLRLAYKNIIYSWQRTLILFITFIIISILTLLFFSIKPFMQSYFYHEHYQSYRDIDFYLTFDENSKARFFSIRELMNVSDLENEFDYIAPVFEAKTLMKNMDKKQDYITVNASSLEHFKKIIDLPSHISSLSNNEMIISKSTAVKMGIEKGDTTYLLLGNEEIAFTVIEVVLENGLLAEDTVLIDKDSHINHYLEALGYSTTNPLLLTNIYNTVYFSLIDDTRHVELKEKIQTIPSYQKFVVKDVVDHTMIETTVTKVGGFLFLIFAFIIGAVILVIYTTLSVVFEERSAQIGVISSLGGRRSFSFLVILMEMFMYLIPSMILAIIIAQAILSKGLQFIGSSLIYQISFNQIIISMGVVWLTIVLITVVQLIKTMATSAVNLSTKNDDEDFKLPIKSFFVVIFSVLVLVINKKVLIHYSPIEYQALLSIIMALLFIFSFTEILLVLFQLVGRNKQKKSLFSLFFIKNMATNKTLKQMTRVILLSFLLLILLVGVNNHIKERLKHTKEHVTIDFAMTNLVYQDDTFSKLKANPQLSHVDQAYLYTNVASPTLKTDFRFALSMDINQLKQYIKLDFEESVFVRMMDSDTPYIILPINYHYLNDLEVGDEVLLNINQTYDHETFVVAGFSDLGFTDMIITNIHGVDKYQQLLPNAIFIRTNNDIKTVKEELIGDYSKDLAVVLDFNEQLDKEISQFTQVTAYMTYLVLAIILCFMMTIFNQMTLLFTKMKPVYSRIRVLGCSCNKLIRMVIIEGLMLQGILILSILPILPIIDAQLGYLLIFYGTFEVFGLEATNVSLAILLGIFMVIISYIYYLFQIIRLKIGRILKEF